VHVDAYPQLLTGNGTNHPADSTTSDCTDGSAWDAENRLLQITYPGSGNNTQFSYDPSGRCVKIVEVTGGSTTSTKQFVWCDNQLCEERDGSGNATKQFFNGGQKNGTTSYFYTSDHEGSIREAIDSSSSVQAQYSYSPFGEVTKISEAVPSDFGFSGYYVHGRSGLNMTRFRLYSSALARWLSRDPIGEGSSYSYVDNRPTGAIDPWGLSCLSGRLYNAAGCRMIAS
jgi:RHS repeat-associated protein